MQAIATADGRRFAAVLYQAGNIPLVGDLSLEVDQPVAVLGQLTSNNLELRVVDLAGQGGAVHVKLRRGTNTINQRPVTIPSNKQRNPDTPAGHIAMRLEN